MDETALKRDGDCMCAVLGIELPEDALEVRLHRLGTTAYRFGDFLVAQAVRDVLEHFKLARGGIRSRRELCQLHRHRSGDDAGRQSAVDRNARSEENVSGR